MLGLLHVARLLSRSGNSCWSRRVWLSIGICALASVTQRTPAIRAVEPPGAPQYGVFSDDPLFRYVSFVGRPFTLADARALREIPEGNRLFLDLSNSSISVDALEFLGQIPQLETLRVCETRLTSPHLEAIGHLKQLWSLEMRQATFPSGDLTKLKGLTNLRALDVSNTSVTDEALQVLASYPLLFDINLGDTKAGDHAMAALCKSGSLTDAMLYKTEVDDGALIALSHACKLKSLWVSGKVTSAGLRSLVGLEDLLELHIREPLVGESLDQALEELLPKCPNLRVLDFEDSGITVDAVAACAQLPKLISLSLGGARISNNRFAALAQLSTLERLDLRLTEFSDRDVSDLLGLKQLSSMGLDGTRITDDGLTRLAKLPQLLSLTTTGTRVTETGKQAFYRAVLSNDVEDGDAAEQR